MEKVKRKERMQLLAREKINQLKEIKLMYTEEGYVYEYNKHIENVGFITIVVNDIISSVYSHIDSLHTATMTTIKQHSPNNKSNKRKKGKNETTASTTASTTSKEGLQLSAEAESLSGFLSQQFTQARSHNHHLPTASTAVTSTTTAAHSDYKKKYDTIHTTTTTTPKRVKFLPAEDDFQFTSQQLLEQAISRTELHFHRSTEATSSTTDTTISTTTPIKKTTTQQRNVGNNLFSPESQRLLDFMDTITFAEVTSQPSISSGSIPTSSLHTHNSSSRNGTAIPTSPRSQCLSRQEPIETKKSVSMKEEYLQDTGSNASRTLSTELSKHTHTSSEVHWQQPQPPLTQQHQQQHRSRVRPNVEYVGRFPISTTNTITQSSRPGPDSYASSMPPASPVSTVTATNLDEAIEQASLLSIQSILKRRPSDRTMPQDPRLTGTFSSSSSTMSHISAPYSVGTEWDMQHTHTQVRIGHDTVHYTAPPQQQQLYTSQTSQYHAQPPAILSTVHPPQQLRRSFDPASAPATRISEHTVKNQNWFSYDEGSRNNTEKNNEMWFLFLKQKRDAEAAARSTNKARPRSSDGVRRPTRPYSIDQSRGAAVTEPHYRSPIIRPIPPSVSQKEDWNISLGGLSRETVEGKPRPVSANGRLHTATSTSNHANAPTAVPTRPSLNDALSSALYDTTFNEEPCNIPQQQQQQVFTSSSERVKTRHVHHIKSEKTSHSRTQQQQRVTGNKNKQHKQEVKERLTSTYIDDKIIF